MKNHPRLFMGRLVVLVGVALLSAIGARAQVFKTLHGFIQHSSDGNNPTGNLFLSSNTLYGTTYFGGFVGAGTIFKINTDGSGYSNIFNSLDDTAMVHPWAGVIVTNGIVYGASTGGGASGNGCVFATSPDGSIYTNLYDFSAWNSMLHTNNDGASPYGTPVLIGSTLYGTTEAGGRGANGTLFTLSTNGVVSGSGFNLMHTFAAALTGGSNTDGTAPNAGMILSGSTLYGTTLNGGNGSGAIFSINTNGLNFSNVYFFSKTIVNSSSYFTNTDGALLYAGLILSSNTLYGTAYEGGFNSYGTIYRVNTDGSSFTNLHNFTIPGGQLRTNLDGTHPYASLTLSGNTLYGTASGGGTGGYGTIFKVNMDGSGFTVLYNFTNGNDGANPYGGVLLSGNTLYGTTYYGGSNGLGTVFSLSLVSFPKLTITHSGTNVILMWPTNFSGFSLQFATNLAASPVWTNASPAPVVINGTNTVTNGVTGTRRYYRLIE